MDSLSNLDWTDMLRKNELRMLQKAVNENNLPEIGHWQKVARSRSMKRIRRDGSSHDQAK